MCPLILDLRYQCKHGTYPCILCGIVQSCSICFLYPPHYPHLQNSVEVIRYYYLCQIQYWSLKISTTITKVQSLQSSSAHHVPLGCNNYSMERLISNATALRIRIKTSLLVVLSQNFGGFYLFTHLSSYVTYWRFILFTYVFEAGCLNSVD